MIHDTQSAQISQKQDERNIYIYIYIYIYVRYHENNVSSQLSPQWLYGNSYTWAHDVHIYIYIHDVYIYIIFHKH